jgi:hypothetical protein
VTEEHFVDSEAEKEHEGLCKGFNVKFGVVS